MTLTVLDDDGVRILHASGDVDAATVPGLLDTAAELVRDVDRVAFDLTDATFFDSSGVRLVDRLLRACAGGGGRFVVVAPPRSGPRRVLELVGYGTLVVDSLTAARAALG